MNRHHLSLLTVTHVSIWLILFMYTGVKTQDVPLAEANDGQRIVAEGDNVFNYANPGGSITYHYTLPDFHLPSGTHW